MSYLRKSEHVRRIGSLLMSSQVQACRRHLMYIVDTHEHILRQLQFHACLDVAVQENLISERFLKFRKLQTT